LADWPSRENEAIRPKEMGKGPRTKLDLDSVLRRVVELFLTHPPHTLTFSKVSRFTGVPRSTLYYYFGNRFANVIAEAVKFGMHAFVQLLSLEAETQKGQKSFKNWQEFQENQFRSALEIITEYPWATATYFRYRGDQGIVGKEAREIETRYLKAFGEAWKLYKGYEADEVNLRLAVYLKLGTLYGFSMEKEFWQSTQKKRSLDEISRKVTQQVTTLLEEKCPT
jgi:AcrR family transcriptional regulator